MDLIIDNSNSKNCDIVVPCLKSYENYKTSSVLINFSKNKELNISIKFILNNNADKLDAFAFWHTENTNLLFFRLTNQWGIIDLIQKSLKRNSYEPLMDFPFFYLHNDCFLIVDDLFAETVDLQGNKIDRIMNEQPHEIEEFDDHFEFEIIGVGKRKLRKKPATNSDLHNS